MQISLQITPIGLRRVPHECSVIHRNPKLSTGKASISRALTGTCGVLVTLPRAKGPQWAKINAFTTPRCVVDYALNRREFRRNRLAPYPISTKDPFFSQWAGAVQTFRVISCRSAFIQFIALLLSSLTPLGCSSSSHQETPQSPTSSAAQKRTWLEPKQVVLAMRGSEEEYRKCFMRAIHQRGIVRTRFSVTKRGTVEELEVVRSTIGQDHVVDCLRSHLQEQHFGHHDGPKKGRWTFVFRLVEPIEESQFQAKLEEARSRTTDGGMQINPNSKGSIDPDSLEEAALAGYPLFARCYRDSISRRTVAGGVLRLRLVIDEQGTVSKVADAGTVLPDPYAVDCIAESFFALRFPKPRGGPVEVDYRLDFQ